MSRKINKIKWKLKRKKGGDTIMNIITVMTVFVLIYPFFFTFTYYIFILIKKKMITWCLLQRHVNGCHTEIYTPGYILAFCLLLPMYLNKCSFF